MTRQRVLDFLTVIPLDAVHGSVDSARFAPPRWFSWMRDLRNCGWTSTKSSAESLTGEQWWDKFLDRAGRLEGAVHPSRAKRTSRDIAHRVIHGTPPVCEKYEPKTGCKFGERWCSFLQKGGAQTAEEKGGWRKRVSGLWNVKHSGCASQDAEPNVTILRKGTKSSRPKRYVHMQDALHSKNSREGKGPSLEVMQPSYRHAQLFALQNSRKEPRRLPVLYLEFQIICYRITGYRIPGCYFTGISKVMLFVTSVPWQKSNGLAEKPGVWMLKCSFCAIVRDEDTTDTGQEPTKMYDSLQARIDTDKTSQYDKRKQGKSQGRSIVTWRTHLLTTLLQVKLKAWVLSQFH